MAEDSKKKTGTVKEQGGLYPEFDRFEIIEGIHYDLSSAPTINHQKLIMELSNSLYTSCRQNGVILTAPLDVYLDEEDNHFQPDLIFIANENTDIIKEKYIKGAPDLVAEILSPSTSANDKIRKKAQYERFGIKEYWIVDPVHLVIDQFILHHEAYHLHATYADDTIIQSEQFSCISVNTAELFAVIR